jgi:ADP-ribosyl-[dinitrogen reductase] hydrolase
MTPGDRYRGCLLGTALGDSLLLPAEGLSRRRIAARFPGPLRHRFLGRRGMVSDDTEHAFLTGQALLEAGDDPDRFARALARRLRWWLVALPGGCGLATARGLLRSWIGIPPDRSGVWSAGNGPAMRSALLGVHWAQDAQRRHAWVRASTLITHRDPQAGIAAQAVADAAAWIVRGEPTEQLWTAWRQPQADAAWTSLVTILADHHRRDATVDEVARALGCPESVSGYAYHSVPLALYAWLRHRHDPRACFAAILACGGDTDTIGAMAGALMGLDDGPQGLPQDLLEGIRDWPLSLQRLRELGHRLSSDDPRPVPWGWPLQPLRNLLFVAIVLAHGFRRLVP